MTRELSICPQVTVKAKERHSEHPTTVLSPGRTRQAARPSRAKAGTPQPQPHGPVSTPPPGGHGRGTRSGFQNLRVALPWLSLPQGDPQVLPCCLLLSVWSSVRLPASSSFVRLVDFLEILQGASWRGLANVKRRPNITSLLTGMMEMHVWRQQAGKHPGHDWVQAPHSQGGELWHWRWPATKIATDSGSGRTCVSSGSTLIIPFRVLTLWEDSHINLGCWW